MIILLHDYVLTRALKLPQIFYFLSFFFVSDNLLFFLPQQLITLQMLLLSFYSGFCPSCTKETLIQSVFWTCSPDSIKDSTHENIMYTILCLTEQWTALCRNHGRGDSVSGHWVSDPLSTHLLKNVWCELYVRCYCCRLVRFISFRLHAVSYANCLCTVSVYQWNLRLLLM